jgi:hypothetical protein
MNTVIKQVFTKKCDEETARQGEVGAIKSGGNEAV